MNTSTYKSLAKRVWCDEDNLWIEMTDGRQLATPLAYFPRLLNAPAEARAKVFVSGGGTGLHWDELDEDISVDGLLRGIGDLTQKRT